MYQKKTVAKLRCEFLHKQAKLVNSFFIISPKIVKNQSEIICFICI